MNRPGEPAVWVAVLAFAGLAACDRAEPPPEVAERPVAEAPAAAPAPPSAVPAGPPASRRELAGDHVRGRVLERIDAASYTYVRVDAGGDEAWAAAPRFEVSVGDEVVVPTSMPMVDHESRTLGRTFDLVFFCSSIEVVGGAAGRGSTERAHAQAPPPAPVDLGGIVRAEGGHTVEEIHAQASRLSGRPVAVRGRVVKFTAGVMGRNWLHLRDGTGAGGSADLTVTTHERAAVGDLVLVEGRVATEQDFGYGYAYDVLVQDARITVE